jgi:hypothetical protein
MSFTCPILRVQRYGRACSQVEVMLTVVGSMGEVSRFFRFDTGCDITTVSEDVAATLSLPSGGTPISVRGSTATTSGRIVPVTFRFPPDFISGLPRPPVNSEWIVAAGQTNVALLSFHEVDQWFYIGTSDDEMSFTDR